MKVIYVAGPYRDDCEFGVKENIDRAEKVALDIWRRGAAAICPHKNTAFFGGAYGLDDSVWLKGDLELLLRCDAVVTVEGWENSSGALREVAEAKEKGIPVFHDRSSFHAWLKSMNIFMRI